MPPMIQTCIHTRNTPSNCAPADHWGLSAASRRMPHAPLSKPCRSLSISAGCRSPPSPKCAAVKQPTLHRYIKGEVRTPPRHPSQAGALCSVDALLDDDRPRRPKCAWWLAMLAVTARRGIHDPHHRAVHRAGLKTVDAFRERDARDQAAAIDGVLSITLS